MLLAPFSVAIIGAFLLEWYPILIDAFSPCNEASSLLIPHQRLKLQQGILSRVSHITLSSTSGSPQEFEPPQTVVTDNCDTTVAATTTKPFFTHADILWKLTPIPEVPSSELTKWQDATTLARKAYNDDIVDTTDSQNDDNTGNTVILLPPGGQAVLEAYLASKQQQQQQEPKKLARFGITTTVGPTAPPLQLAAHVLFDDDSADDSSNAAKEHKRIVPLDRPVAACAIKYMFVEEAHRRRNLGGLALEIIEALHTAAAANVAVAAPETVYTPVTILVADDNGSGKLVEWYQQHGYEVAPQIQDLLGSPDACYGVTMMKLNNLQQSETTELKRANRASEEEDAFTNDFGYDVLHGVHLPLNCRLEWW